jgi:hypothetical protein
MQIDFGTIRCSQMEGIDVTLSGIKSAVRCKLSDGYDQVSGMANDVQPTFISPDRRGPDRKKCRVKQTSPERIARQNSAFKQISNTAMYVPFHSQSDHS